MEAEQRNFSNVPIIWKPTGELRESKKIFIQLVKDKYKVKIDSYWDLHKWSIENLEEFWKEVWDFSDIIYSQKYQKVIDLNIPMDENPKWFEGARLNYAENLLRYRDDKVAIITAGEEKKSVKITYAEVYEKSRLYAAAFRKMGIKKKDVIVCYMSNREEPVYAMIAATSIGAIWTGALPLLGAQALLNRFQRIGPKVLLTIGRFQDSQEEHEMLDKVSKIAKGLPSLQKVIIVPSKEDSNRKDLSKIRNSCFLEDFLKTGLNEDGTVPEITFEQVSPSHPVFISFTSGTTGSPKAIMHGASILLGLSRDIKIQAGRGRDSVTISKSPVGWATWISFTSFLTFGTTILLYEGCPFYMSPTYIWDLIEEHKITLLFITPSVLDDFEKKGYVPTEKHTLSSLQDIVCGGSVVKPNNYDFVFQKVKKDVRFFSGYGCTEILSSTVTVESSLPIYKGEVTCPSLGMHLQILDEFGNPVIGDLGEFVLAKPAPQLPIGLWGDTDGSLYKKTYFSKYPGKFSIGDLAVINPITKGFVFHCRSDETIKQRGCRFGSSEIYCVVNQLHEIYDSLCVSQYSKNHNERAVLFIKMKKGHQFDEEFEKKIRSAIQKELTSRHVPDLILEATDIPHNMNGKKMESLVKKIINNLPFNAETVINKECLDEYKLVPPYVD